MSSATAVSNASGSEVSLSLTLLEQQVAQDRSGLSHPTSWIYFPFDEFFSKLSNLRCLFGVEIKYTELIEAGYTQTSVYPNNN